MKTSIRFLSFLALMVLPLTILAQHHHGHDNSNALSAADVNTEHSLYHMKAEWISHRMDSFKLSDLKGKPVIAVMYYGNCTQVCPILIRDARRVFEEVDEELQKDVRVLAITFDPQNDTPERLRNYAEDKGLNLLEWNFVTGKNSDIRELAMLLGVEYAKKSDGHFAHSNLVTVLNGEGRIIHRMEGLNQPVEEAARLIEKDLESRRDHM